ncbi:hypothetical protein RND71_035665 [Anisodus tanguticus]|uniref:Uncharacterized protein n=1 Tax=Anisodus tanguticus TaxID=243964 RepID=A0AAE1V1R8_9SOLA|nr:hypothetical protein RND71_035665 [Anisodus tanguticus]
MDTRDSSAGSKSVSFSPSPLSPEISVSMPSRLTTQPQQGEGEEEMGPSPLRQPRRLKSEV